ncbi:transposase [Caldicellulosiruptor changbaiensis]|uniref:transposase n=1 Tax=Caldicellulosiruptor changbaiensis TaxID=1222016 RepID=UPI0027D9B7E1|nr:transposase [Caldicellulosiruptor changbaiensis]
MPLFYPSVLPQPYKRVDPSYTDLLMSLVANSYSESLLIQTLKNLDLPYSEEEITKIKNDLKNELQLFKQRELPENALLLSIDSYSEVKLGTTQKLNRLPAMSFSASILDSKKDIFGIYTFFGKENKADWMKVFEDLISRGLKKVLIIVSDDFPINK